MSINDIGPKITIDCSDVKKTADALVRARASTVKSIGYKGMEALRSYVETGSSRWPPLRQVTLLLSKTGKTSPFYFLGRFARYLANGEESVTVGFLPYKNYPVKDWIASAETGKTTPVSPRMRRWFARRGFPLRGSTKNLIQPARPIFREFWTKFQDKITDEYAKIYVKRVEKYANNSRS